MLLKVFFPGSLRMDARFSNWRKESEEKKTRGMVKFVETPEADPSARRSAEWMDQVDFFGSQDPSGAAPGSTDRYLLY